MSEYMTSLAPSPVCFQLSEMAISMVFEYEVGRLSGTPRDLPVFERKPLFDCALIDRLT